jgi:ribonuclease HI
MKPVVVHSDGACRGNPGPGGWAAVLVSGTTRRELSGGAPATTNNRMELQAAIEALTSLEEHCAVEFFTDSKYVQNGITSWLAGWKRGGWLTKARQPVKNADLWRALDAAATPHRVQWRWLKGHAGHAENERCDVLANAAIDNIQATHTAADLRERLRAFTADAASPSPTAELMLF